jgi:hypothetical protein
MFFTISIFVDLYKKIILKRKNKINYPNESYILIHLVCLSVSQFVIVTPDGMC